MEEHKSEKHEWLSEQDYEWIEVSAETDYRLNGSPTCKKRKRRSDESFSDGESLEHEFLTEADHDWLDMIEKIDYLNHGSPPCKKKKKESYDLHLEKNAEPSQNVNPRGDTCEGTTNFWRPWGTGNERNVIRQVGMGSSSDDSSRREIAPDSPKPGPSRDSRWRMTSSPVQEHPSVTDSPPRSPDSESGEKRGLSYTYTKIGERRFKNSVIDRHYSVKFDLNADSENMKLSHMYAQLESMFDRVLQEAAEGLQSSDLVRVIIHHGDLSNPVYVPLRPLSEMTGNSIMEYIQNVLNSHENLPLDHSFSLDVGTMELPRGGRRMKIIRVEGTDNSLMRKRSIIEIVNRDNTCLARAIAMGFAKANLVTPTEWKEAIRGDERPREEVIIDLKKCSASHFSEMTRKTLRGENEHLKRLALAMCRRVNAPHRSSSHHQRHRTFRRAVRFRHPGNSSKNVKQVPESSRQEQQEKKNISVSRRES